MAPIIITGSVLAFCTAVWTDGTHTQTAAQPVKNAEINNNNFLFHQKENLIQISFFKSRNTNPKSTKKTSKFLTRSMSMVSKSMPSLRSSIRPSDDIITSSTIGSSSSSIRLVPRRLKWKEKAYCLALKSSYILCKYLKANIQ